MADSAIRRLTDEEVTDEVLLEQWQRETDESEVRDVEAYRLPHPDYGTVWEIALAAGEFVREDPLRSELSTQLEHALRSVPGVTVVRSTGNWETWMVFGDPAGHELMVAACEVIDRLAPKIRTHIEEL